MMLKKILKLEEERVLVEQLRIVLGNVASALIPTLFLSMLLIWALTNDSNGKALVLWGVMLMSYKLFANIHARQYLKNGIPPEKAKHLVRVLIFLNGLDGAIWGSLAWITLDSSTVVGSILVISTIAGMVGSSLSRLAPVLPVFFAFVIAMLLLLSLKVWQLNDPAYEALGAVAIIYLTSVSLMARNSSQEILKAINLRFTNISLVEQLKTKTRIAESAQREAEYANAAKSKFLAAASHDLRQPIHAQGLFLEVLSRTALSAKQKELMASIMSASDATAELLDSLLDFSRIEAGVIEPQIRPVSLQPLFAKISKEFQAMAAAKNLFYRTHPTKAVVESDPVLLERILRNLISNAIRYTEAGGMLIGCRIRGKQVVIEVWDTGIGIDSAFQEEVFREFHQLGNPERDRRKGLGLGLAIAQGLARKLGHHLSLKSQPSKGSVFRLTLPVTAIERSEKTDELKIQESKLAGVKILVVDDERTVRDAMKQLLRDWGAVCEVAESVEEAIMIAKKFSPELVICDYRLRENRTGVEVVASLRQLLGDHFLSLLVTGDTGPDRLREAQNSGIPLIHKPVTPDNFYRTLVSMMENVGMQ